MSLVISQSISSIIQIVLFASVPFIWWLITARNKCGFADWIGFKKAGEESDGLILWIAGTSAAFLLVSAPILYLLRDIGTAASEFDGLGAAAIPAVLIYAIFHTALPEEILFRGFLLKRIAGRFGFAAGNTVQAAAFGIMHGIMFFSAAGAAKAVLIILFTYVIAWFIGYTNEKKAAGSILPGWFIHAAANIFSGICSAFLLF